MPEFYYEMPVGILSTIHNMCIWMGYDKNREFSEMTTAYMACSIMNDTKDVELSLKNILIK